MRQTEEITVKVQLTTNEQAFNELADAYSELAQKVRSEGSRELLEAFFKFSQSFEGFLKTLSLKLDDSSATTVE